MTIDADAGAGAAGAPPIDGIPAGAGTETVPGAGAATTEAGGAVARIAPCTPNSFSTISPDRTPSCAMMSSSVAAAAKNAPAGLPVSRSVTTVSRLYPFPSLETVPWSSRGTFASFAAASGALPAAGRSTTSAPASAIRRVASRRGRTDTVSPMSSFVREVNGAMAMRRE